ncbi:MAG: DMT family transporter [Maricaulaceae bacterium]
MAGRNWGYVLALFGTIFFSMKAILVKLVYLPGGGLEENQLDAITIMAMRLGFSFPAYMAIFWIVKRRAVRDGQVIKGKDMLLAAMTGVLGYYVCAWLDIQGLKYITSQLERMLLFTYPVFVFLLGAMFFGKPLTKGAIAAIIMAYAGIAIIFTNGDMTVGLNVPLGASMVLFCAFFFALFQLLAKPMIARLGSLLFTCCAMMGAGAVIFVHFLSQNIAQGTFGEIAALPPRIWAIGISLAFLSTLLPSFLVNIAIGRIGPQAVAAMGMVSPIATIILAITWLGEPFGIWDALGTLLTIFGIGLYTWFDRR